MGQLRLYAAAAVAACLGALALSVASAWSQAPTGGVSAPPAPVTSGSGGVTADPEPAPVMAAVPRLAQQTPPADDEPPSADQSPPTDQPPPEGVPEHRQELQQQVPLEHLKPKPPAPGPVPLPALAPVRAFAGALPNTGIEPLTLGLTGLALLAMSVSFRAAAALRPA